MRDVPRSRSSKSRLSETKADEGWSFPIVCEVGRVTMSDTADQGPVEAAFRVIARHDAPGVFTFPSEDGGMYRVTVEVPQRETP